MAKIMRDVVGRDVDEMSRLAENHILGPLLSHGRIPQLELEVEQEFISLEFSLALAQEELDVNMNG